MGPGAADPVQTVFGTIDDIAADSARSGVIVITGRKADLQAIGRHIARRSRAVGRPVAIVGGAHCDEPWRELAAFGRVDPHHGPELVASELIGALGACAAIVHDERPSRWGAAVADACAQHAASPQRSASLLFVLSESAGAVQGASMTLAVGQALDADDVARWWRALAADRPGSLVTLADLDGIAHGRTALRVGLPPAAEPRDGGAPLSEPAEQLLGRMALCLRSCSPELCERLGSLSSRDELVAAGLVRVDELGRSELCCDGAPAVDQLERRSVAEALLATQPQDAWASMRAAELFAQAGTMDAAEQAAIEALRTAGDSFAREDLYARIDLLLQAAPQPSAGWLLLLAQLALGFGDLDRALAFARDAAARDAERADVMLMLGRTSTARGDLRAAGLAFERAAQLADDRRWQSRVAAQRADYECTAGNHDVARQHAEAALELADDEATELAARNVLGKLLLAAADWQRAEEHFASDAAAAACAGELEAELRARLNRSIAVMEAGRLNHARALMESVLQDARRQGHQQAETMALANLATVLTLTHEYADALDRSEQAIEAMQALGDQLRRSALIMNLAELRLRLGLVAEAEEALRFARRTCGPSVPPTQVTLLSFVAAKIHLTRGQTDLAQADLAEAIAAAGRSPNGAKLGQCHRLATRIALEDGDLQRAAGALDRARSCVSRPDAQADIAVLRARLERAAGGDFEPLAAEALALAETADDDERRREAHQLLHHAASDNGDGPAAQEHLRRAVVLRDRMARNLPAPLRERFLARRDLGQLSDLEQTAAEGLVLESQASSGVADHGSVAAPTTRRSGRRPAPAPRTMVGLGSAMNELRSTIAKVGRSDVTVLIQGESGTGKELVAEALHAASDRADGPLVKVNCAALVETLLLSELFGHEKGAFTGASSRRRGRFEQAAGGTLFLDEIGDISPRTQVALLRVLQEKTFERVGGTTAHRADVRVVCATNRDLQSLVATGQFREDLYYRLCGVSLNAPALRERLEDLPTLADALLERIAAEHGALRKQLAPEVLEALASHPWPGNVRELENALRTAALFAEGEGIGVDDFARNVPGLSRLSPPPTESSAASSASALSSMAMCPSDVVYAEVRAGASLPDLKRQLEHACIARALEDAEGNITRAASILGMKRSRLSQLVNQHGLKAEGGRS